MAKFATDLVGAVESELERFGGGRKRIQQSLIC